MTRRLLRHVGWIPGRPPTDFEVLLAIYEHHKSEFVDDMEDRQAPITVPIDIPTIAAILDVHP
jgi:hypothetical protein